MAKKRKTISTRLGALAKKHKISKSSLMKVYKRGLGAAVSSGTNEGQRRQCRWLKQKASNCDEKARKTPHKKTFKSHGNSNEERQNICSVPQNSTKKGGQMRRKKKRKMNRKVAKDKTYKTVPKKYLTGTKGAKRKQRARDIARMQRIYKQGKKIPKSLYNRVFG